MSYFDQIDLIWDVLQFLDFDTYEITNGIKTKQGKFYEQKANGISKRV